MHLLQHAWIFYSIPQQVTNLQFWITDAVIRLVELWLKRKACYPMWPIRHQQNCEFEVSHKLT
jgi:hypothetical protein